MPVGGGAGRLWTPPVRDQGGPARIPRPALCSLLRDRKKDPFLLLDIFSNDLKESARLNELVHLAALEAAATRRQEEGETEEGRAGRRRWEEGAGGRRGERENAESGGEEEAKRMRWQRQRRAGVCLSPGCLLRWPGIHLG